MSPRCEALARALELAEAEAARSGSVIAQVEVDALRRELKAELARDVGVSASTSRPWKTAQRGSCR